MYTKFIVHSDAKSEINSKIVAYHRPESIPAEQYRNIHTYISSLNGGEIFRSIMITSANRQEGKTLTSVNLAVIMAEAKEKSVLLIDTNFRSPVIGKMLGLAANMGLSNYLNKEIPLNLALNQTSVENLTVLPAGDKLSNPAELLASRRMKELLRELEKSFNYIIIDTPAIIPFADARILAPHVDGVLLVVQAGKTRREVVWRLQEQISKLRAKLLGAILTNVEYYIPEYIHRHL